MIKIGGKKRQIIYRNEINCSSGIKMKPLIEQVRTVQICINCSNKCTKELEELINVANKGALKSSEKYKV